MTQNHLHRASIDDAMTALAVARTQRDELIAYEALAAAAQLKADQLRAHTAKTPARKTVSLLNTVEGSRRKAQDSEATPKAEQLLRLPDVMERTALKKSSIYRGVRSGHFPSPLRVTRRGVRWKESEVQAWITGRSSGATA